MPDVESNRYDCFVANDRKRVTRPKLATTSGILYSRQETSETNNQSTDAIWGCAGGPPELPTRETFRALDFRADEELVTPSQGLLQSRTEQHTAGFPFLNDLYRDNYDVPRQLRANSVTDESLDTVSSAGNTSAGHGTRGTASTSSIHKKTQYHKTKLCPWHKEGKCFMGDVCNYAHTREELRPKPDLSKTKLCPEIVKNKRCDRPGCRFAHDFVELRATSTFFKTRLCKFWQRGYCPAGPECRHAHGREDLRSETNESEGSKNSSVWASAQSSGKCSPETTTPSPDSGLTPLFMQCAELLSQQSEAEVVHLLRRLAGEGEGLLPQGLLESPRHPDAELNPFLDSN